MENNNTSIYLSALNIERLMPFSDKEINIRFTTDRHRIRPAQWTVMLGNNNTGKTRVLRIIANTLKAAKGDKKLLFETYKDWEANEITKILTDDEDNIELAGQNIKIEIEKAASLVREKFASSGTVIGLTLYRDKVLENINEGDYIASKTERDENGRAKVSLAIDDCSYIVSTEEGKNPFYIGYGVNRKVALSNLSNSQIDDPTASLFSSEVGLLNVEDWLIQTDYASKNGVQEAQLILEKIKTILTGGVLPDVKDFKLTSIKYRSGVKNYVEFLTDYGWISFDKLGYGYQASITWLLDLAKRMLDQYSDEPNPLAMPAIVLVDEIDLHLHPSWQRKLLNYLSNIFPNVQFIVTAHSPLIIQSAKEINLILLRKEGNHVNISQPDISTYKGWSIEEILSEVMGLDEYIYSDAYLNLIKSFDEALDNDDYKKANIAYQELDAILPPDSNQRKLLRIQMASLDLSN